MLKNDYSNLINELLIEVDNFSDNECFKLSAKKESEYISQKSPRIKQTIDYFEYFLNENKYENRKFRILDIGTTPFTWLYGKYFDAQVSSIDLSNLMERRCKLNNVIFKRCNLLEEDIPFPENEFDVIIFTEVFEHLVGSPQLIFNRIKMVLNNKGILVFSTPNIASHYNAVKLLLGKPILAPVYEVFPEETQGNWAHGSGHWRKFTMGELLELLERYQFKVIKYKYTLKPFLDINTKNLIKFVKRVSFNLMVSLLPPSLFNLILASKK